jgi:hypothetical protein
MVLDPTVGAPVSGFFHQAPEGLFEGANQGLGVQGGQRVAGRPVEVLQGHHQDGPQGSKLIGTYDAQPVFGQQRVLLVWSRLILPDGRSLVLDKAGSSDPQGYAVCRIASIVIGVIWSAPRP